MTLFAPDARLVIGVLTLIGTTTLVLRLAQVPLGWGPAWAVLRGGVQLALVGLALRGVFTAPPLVGLALTIMLAVAIRTAAGRIKTLPGALPAVALACTAAAVSTLAVVFALGMLELSARYLVALGGIVIGGTMLAATLTGRRLAAGLESERDEIEGLLAIGATPRQATARICRRGVAEAMMPVIDQTRTTGLVTLPGAFIGALLGGADPMDAARFQLVVLTALINAQAISGVIVAYRLGAPAQLPAPAPNPA